jgi:hypothetical protein
LQLIQLASVCFHGKLQCPTADYTKAESDHQMKRDQNDSLINQPNLGLLPIRLPPLFRQHPENKLLFSLEKRQCKKLPL